MRKLTVAEKLAHSERTSLKGERERFEEAFHQACADRRAADQAAGELRTQLEEIAGAGPIRALRLRRKVRDHTG